MATLGLAKFAKFFLWGFSFNYGFNENLKDSYYFKKDDKLFKGVGGSPSTSNNASNCNKNLE